MPHDAVARHIGPNETFARPSDSSATMEQTRLALEAIVHDSALALNPQNVPVAQQASSFIRFTSESSERTVLMATEQIDPIEPPKFKHKKLPKPPPSPPPPVLHSPPRKATAEEQKAWLIPPSISKWKNQKGHTVPLDKRIFAPEAPPTINDRFSKVSKALQEAEARARSEIEIRNELEQKRIDKERQIKEEALRSIAAQSRQERAKLSQDKHVQERERLRQERAKEHDREQRYYEKRPMGERDIGEKMALGAGQPVYTDESLYDERLFHKAVRAPLGSEDAYHLYDKPLISGSTANLMYHPSEQDIQREQATGLGSTEKKEKSGPVLFEKGDALTLDSQAEVKPKATTIDADLDAFFQEIKKTRR